MTRLCRVSGCCASASSRYSIYCTTHKARLRRHGAVDQQGITKGDLKPYLRLVQARVEKNQESPLWPQLEARLAALADHARSLLAYRGAMSRHERIAAKEVVKLSDAVAPWEIVQTTLALVIMQELQPRRFKTDRAFRTQLVRRVRGLTDLNAGSWFDHQTGKTKRAYKELTPRAAAVIAQWLADAFGGAGLHLAKLEQTEADKKQQEQQAIHASLSQLT
ncbi:hypothetical protein J4G37_26680 [Microvirga sp. 3-52]|nr:hypothetical protein [Microvirga sp. 3-52]